MQRKITAVITTLALFVGTIAAAAFAFGTQKSITVEDGVTVYMNGEKLNMIDADGNPVSAFVYDGTTYLPARAISEANGKNVEWDGETGSVYITDKEQSEKPTETQETATVYFTKDISSEGMVKIYEKLGVNLTGKVGVKMSTGEAGNTYYLHPDLIKQLVDKVNGTIIECNTAYGGSRATTAAHEQTIKDHGFDLLGGVDIMDRDGSMELPVAGGDHLTTNYVGKNLANYDSILVLSHFKGHQMGGFGGALKNISIGIGSQEGKVNIHTAGAERGTNIFPAAMSTAQSDFIESMAEAAKSVIDYENGNMVYINVMNNLSVDCDCVGNPTKPTMADIGILASTDPVAIDKACVDLVYAAEDGADLVERMESRLGPHILEHAEKIGAGSTKYNLVSID
ncbi:MAG: DUF362 domain-containing protein [Candidatus Ornithomonoglobus sp.]